MSAAPVASSYAIDGDIGSNGTWQARLGIESLLAGGWNIRAQLSRFETDGVRPHSEAQRTLGNIRLGWLGSNDTLTPLLNGVDQPAQDPLGLTRQQFDEDPYQTAPQATLFDTRKTSAQTQLGGTWRHRFEEAGALRASAVTLYYGQRDVTQWQSIPVAAQGNPRHPGGVIDFGRSYSGVDARLSWRWERVTLTAGVVTERQGEDRRGYENFSGSADDPTLGVTGKLRRQETNSVRTSDLYAQGEVEFGPSLTASLGLRSGSLNITTQDEYLANGDDSGSLSYHYTTPVVALQWMPAPDVNLYVSAGKGFESPTLGELAYRPDGEPGLNTSLQPQTSKQFEIGAKWRDAALGLALDAAIFRANTSDEIGVLTNAGGRSTFQNVGRTRRSGAELGLRWQIAPAWRTQMALTYLDATYRDGFETCTAVPCSTPADRSTVPAGNRIAGTMAQSAFAALAWQAYDSTELAAEVRLQGDMPVNDRNSDFSSTAWVGALRASRTFALGPGTLSLLARLDNISGLRYAGSVIVNDVNGRYFETASGRTWLLAAHWRAPF